MFCSNDIPSIVLPIAYQSADLRRCETLDLLHDGYCRGGCTSTFSLSSISTPDMLTEYSPVICLEEKGGIVVECRQARRGVACRVVNAKPIAKVVLIRHAQ